MRRDDKASYAGITKITAGVHSSTAPIALPPNQLAWGVNLDCRSDFMRPRPGWGKQLLTFNGREDFCVNSADVQTLFEDHIFQGAIVFERFSQIVTMIGGHLFSVKPVGGGWTVTDLTPVTSECEDCDDCTVVYDDNATNRYRAWFCEAESWVIAQDGDSIPLIYNGASVVRSDTLGAGGKPQVPIGKAMCYAQGRLHVAYASGRAFVIGDIVGGDSGTAAFGFKDSVLYFTENDVINGGGSFSVPINAGLLTAFRPVAQIDTSMGQGPTQVFTTNAIFSLNLPTDRATWQDVNFPIGTVSNIANGATSDRCTPNVNGDIWFRAPDGVRAFLVARRDFQAAWINAPLSQEVSRSLDGDDENLLEYASAALFDNRLLMTTHPYRVWGHGIVHEGLVQLDFQPVATLSERNPLPTWLGNATGLRVLQVLSGNIKGIPRCFIFALNDDDKIELWEVSRRAAADATTDAQVPIEWSFETAAFPFTAPGGSGDSMLPGRELWSLDGARLYVDEIEGDVSFAFQWRPDQDPCWHDWHSWSVCANVDPCPIPEDCGCPGRPQYRKYFNLPAPRDACDTAVDKPPHIGREFQVRAVITGRCRVKMLELVAHAQEEDVTKLCQASEECVTVHCLPPNDFAYEIEPLPEPPRVTGACCIAGVCSINTQANCELLGGVFLGADTECGETTCNDPDAPTGACCLPSDECVTLTELACAQVGGVYRGDNTTCEGVDCSQDFPNLPAWPIPTPLTCEGRALWSAIEVTDPLDGTAFVGINPGELDPNAYLTALGATGCLEAWCQEVWDQFVVDVPSHSNARLVWAEGTLTGSNWQGFEVFPAQAGGYHGVINLNTFITVEYCPS